ncbi:MMP23 protein, partial [Ramphastos sulfuratus]|nr:MMP23 protein [Ramphastos sulfuratus]
RILSFPRNLLSARDTRRGLAAAFRMWSEVSPFSFREVPRHMPSDLKIGKLQGPCAHRAWKGHREIIQSNPPARAGPDNPAQGTQNTSRQAWKGSREEDSTASLGSLPNHPGAEISLPMSFPGVWLTDLVHVAAHEIGHALGLMHSLNPNALMHINATLTGKKIISQDEVWGIHRLYGCRDRLVMCPSWARKGFCERRRKLMKRHCPATCDFCYEFPFPTVPPTLPPPRTKTKTVSEGRNVTFRCGQKIIHKKGKVYWYKDQELLEYSYPGYLSLNEDHMSIIANAINEGTYTCIVRKKERILTTYSWRIRLKH